MPPTVVWEHKVPYTPQLVVLAQAVGFVHSQSQVSILHLGYASEGVGCTCISQKEPIHTCTYMNNNYYVVYTCIYIYVP